MINYFKDCQTLDEAKKLFWDLAKQFHPDKGGSKEQFQDLQNQFENFKPQSEKFEGEADKWNAFEYASIIKGLITIPEIEIEIIGSWIWVTGNTKPYKDRIKEIDTGDTYKRGFHKKKECWYFSPRGYRKHTSKEYSLDEIRASYGGQKVEKEEQKKISA